MEVFTPTPRTAFKRLPQRGTYDREAVYRILDEAFICHVGFVVDGQPFVIPTGYARVGDTLYIHGSAASRMLRLLAGGIPVCVTVTLVDGLVLARSAFHHSINYRSVVILGIAEPVEDEQGKMAALAALTEHIVPGRWAEVRGPNEQELKGTSVLALPLVEVSAKIRTGPPKDDEEDYAIPVWAGELPLRIAADAPVNDPQLSPGIAPPAYITNHFLGADHNTRRNTMTQEERKELIARYAAGYDEVISALEGFPKDKLMAHPIAGKWSAAEIVQHLADSEMTSAIRLRRLLVEDRPVIQGYDQELFATRLNYNERNIAPALEAFRGARSTTVQLLERMTEEDWRREGTHTESGHYTAEDWLRIYAAHAHGHADQIRRLREVLS
jgi:hypothetical protein